MSDGDTKNSTLQDGHTAILVVHGVGQQNKFETLSAFAAGLKINLEKCTEPQSQLSVQRLLQNHGDRNVSLLRLSADGFDVAIDVFEYYYQHKLQRQVSVPDVVEWLLTTSRRIRVLYETNNYLKDSLAKSRGKKPSQVNGLELGYMLVGAAWIMPFLIKGIGLLLPFLKGLSQGMWLGPLGPVGRLLFSIANNFIYTHVDRLITDFAGDVTAYTAIDPKLRLNRVRKDILSGCVEKIKAIFEQKDNGAYLYDRIIIAGHSLGSVVAYDALSQISDDIATGRWRLASDHDAKRFVALVTFGSPLDKIALFFWPLNEDQMLRMKPVRYALRLKRCLNWPKEKLEWMELSTKLQSGMVAHFHGMRGLRKEIADYPSVVNQPDNQPLEHVIWLNFYHPKDLIAGHLDAFKGVENIKMYGKDEDEPPFPESHSFYWYNSRMFQSIIENIL